LLPICTFGKVMLPILCEGRFDNYGKSGVL
jgi:hypothetical protein